MNRTIIAGSRSIKDYRIVKTVMDTLVDLMEVEVGEVVSGGAIGVDQAGERWAEESGVTLSRHLPDYELYDGKVAPLVRNKVMAKYAAATPGGKLVLIHNGSRGSAHMKAEAVKRGLTIYEYAPSETAPKIVAPLLQDYFAQKAKESAAQSLITLGHSNWENVKPKDIASFRAWAYGPVISPRNVALITSVVA